MVPLFPLGSKDRFNAREGIIVPKFPQTDGAAGGAWPGYGDVATIWLAPRPINQGAHITGEDVSSDNLICCAAAVKLREKSGDLSVTNRPNVQF
jgi:hypothetical protein